MLFLLRNIRRKLLNNNKVGTYLLYAIGEIFLVVAGILIAVQIDDWNEGRKRDQQAYTYLQRLAEDVELILDDVNNSKVGTERNLMNSILVKNALENRKLSIEDRENFESFLYQYHQYYISIAHSNTHAEMLSAGELNLIENRWIRDALSNISNYRDFVVEVNRAFHDKAILDADHYAKYVGYELQNVGTDSTITKPKYDIEAMSSDASFVNLISKQSLTYNGVLGMFANHQNDLFKLRDSIQLELKKYD